jgi:hypothetical protein
MLNLQEQFKYHPPDAERAKKHEQINKYALLFAEIVAENIENPDTVQNIINQIQVARMLANQALTYESLDV